MPEIRDQHLRSIMDSIVAMQDHAHKLMVDMAEVAGFARRRIVDVNVGDEIAWGTNYWRLVVDTEQSATPEGDGIVLVHFEDGGESLFDPADIVDVQAMAPLEPF